ncbi:MAG: transglutaminase domain-containing protein, partial [Fimbriimonadaceae bacterium]|nr:transglutaminase domain-containing protein [Fimbriimonadaceae bacterium]
CAVGSFSIGQSVGKPILASFLVIIAMLGISIGGVLGYFLRNTKIVEWDAAFSGIVGFLVFATTRQLNGILPEEGFPFSLIVASTLSWLIFFVGVFAWRDATLLFVSLPALAMFGLVGTFDTYPLGTFFFFVYLVCIAVLYSRTHYRNMVSLAKDAGVEEPSLLHRDSWRWMADSSWALGSAGVIIVLALIGGPLLQVMVRTVAPDAPLQFQEAVRQRNEQIQTGLNRNQQVDVRVGRGAITISEEKVFEIKTSAGEYYRAGVYDQYTGNGWSNARQPITRRSGRVEGDRLPAREIGPNGGWLSWLPNGQVPLEPIENRDIYRVQIRNVESIPALVWTPGPVVEVLTQNVTANALPNGFVSIVSRLTSRAEYDFTVARSVGSPANAKSVNPIDNLSQRTIQNLYQLRPNEELPRPAKPELSSRVRNWIREATAGATTDYEKAERLRKAISEVITYDTRTEALAADKDAVDAVLFETKRGYCDLFATAMTACAMDLGLTARYVVGYFDPGLEYTDDGYSVVRNKYAHAWSEIYFDGVGYVVFDATEGSRMAPGGERSQVPTEDRSPFARFLSEDISGWLLGSIALIGVAAFLAMRRPWEAIGRRGTESRLTNAHQKFIQTIEGVTRSPKRFSMTTREYIEASAASLFGTGDEAKRLAAGFDRAFFGPETPDDDLIARLEGELKEWSHALREAKP